MSSFFSDFTTLLREPFNAIHSYRTVDAEKVEVLNRLNNPQGVIGYGFATEKVTKIICDFIEAECHISSKGIMICHDGNPNHHETADAVGQLNHTLVTGIIIGTGDALSIHYIGALTPSQKFIIAHEVEHLVKGHCLLKDTDIKKSSKASVLAWGVCMIALTSLNIASIPLSYIVGCTAGKIARYVSYDLSVQKHEDEADDFAKTLSPEILKGGIEAIKRIQEEQKKDKATFPSPVQYLKDKIAKPAYPTPWKYCKDWFKRFCIASNGDNYRILSHLSSRRILRLSGENPKDNASFK